MSALRATVPTSNISWWCDPATPAEHDPDVPAHCESCGDLVHLIQVCHRCRSGFCSGCYYPWNAMSCPACRDIVATAPSLVLLG
jgi:hypothetical protein